MEEELIKRQKEIDKKYAEEGLTDEVLDLQIKLNQDRNKYDITDPEQRVYKRFVQ